MTGDLHVSYMIFLWLCFVLLEILGRVVVIKLWNILFGITYYSELHYYIIKWIIIIVNKVNIITMALLRSGQVLAQSRRRSELWLSYDTRIYLGSTLRMYNYALYTFFYLYGSFYTHYTFYTVARLDRSSISCRCQLVYKP